MNDITVREVMLAGSPSQVAESIELWAWYLPRRGTGTWVEKPVEITSRRDRADYSIYIKALDAPGGTAALKGRLISAPTGARLFIRGDADAWAASRTWLDALLDELRRVGWVTETDAATTGIPSEPPIPDNERWTSDQWDAIFDWFYRVPRYHCPDIQALADVIGREYKTVLNKHSDYTEQHGKDAIRE